MKTCKICGIQKELSEYYKHPQMADGYLGKCKECQKANTKAAWKRNPEHYKAYDDKRATLPHRVSARLAYSKTESGIDAGNRAKKKWGVSNLIKRKASEAVNNAVRDGKLLKSFCCEECGIVDGVRIHGHHDDYSKPLDVRWLCAACHTQWHKENGEGINGQENEFISPTRTESQDTRIQS